MWWWITPIKNLYSLCSILLVLSATGTWASAAGSSGIAEEREKSVGHYIYWDDGLHLTGPWRKLKLLWNVKVDGDAGTIDADEALQAAFPDLDGNHLNLRRADISLLGHFTFGHMKEPFSLENLTSSTYTTFMERSLATRAISPSRNIGVSAAGIARSERITWAAGAFINTGSFSSQRQALDRLSDANGYDVTGRITWLPQYENSGRRLFHLGMSYSHRFRDDESDDPTAQFRSRPESYLTDDRLIDTRRFFNRGQDLINFEAAWVNGPLSLFERSRGS